MALEKYTYEFSDFPNGLKSLTRLSTDVTNETGIITGLSYIERYGTDVNFWFKAFLNNSEWSALSGVVSSHDGLPLKEDPQEVTVISGVSVSNQPIVIPFKPTQNATTARAYIFSPDLCKQETWYHNSVSVTEIIGTGDNVETKFNFSHGSGLGEAIVDLSHYKVTDEQLISPPSGSEGGYVPIISVTGVQRVEREAFEQSGGDYEIDYLDGSVTFYTPPSGEISATYYYVPSGTGPIIEGGPPSGTMWLVDAAEAQFSTNLEITDTIVQNVFTLHPTYGWIRIPEEMGGAKDAEYGHAGNYLDYSYGSFPNIPVFGGGTRGLSNETIIFRWDYEVSITLIPGTKIKVWTKHGRGFNGERATMVLYAKAVPYP